MQPGYAPVRGRVRVRLALRYNLRQGQVRISVGLGSGRVNKASLTEALCITYSMINHRMCEYNDV